MKVENQEKALGMKDSPETEIRNYYRIVVIFTEIRIQEQL